MKVIKGFKIEQIPIHKIVFIATSDQAYEMDRTIFVENYPSYSDDYTIVSGGHCSCYGFDDTEWEAVIYSEDELKKVATGWLAGDGSEKIIAPLILKYLEY
jgi:hypothetical protein